MGGRWALEGRSWETMGGRHLFATESSSVDALPGAPSLLGRAGRAVIAPRDTGLVSVVGAGQRRVGSSQQEPSTLG